MRYLRAHCAPINSRRSLRCLPALPGPLSAFPARAEYRRARLECCISHCSQPLHTPVPADKCAPRTRVQRGSEGALLEARSRTSWRPHSPQGPWRPFSARFFFPRLPKFWGETGFAPCAVVLAAERWRRAMSRRQARKRRCGWGTLGK